LIYDWERRWLPRDIGDRLNGNSPAKARAFQAVWQLQFASEGDFLEKLRHVPCLILLGEPGMGKTYALRREHGSLDDSPLFGFVTLHYVDLAGSQGTENVRAQLFDNEVYREWKSGTHWLIFFIDSVDQSHTPVEHVITVICNELAAVDISRLQLRLVCRDYDWSLSLADALRHIWRNVDGAPVRVYQLAPLNVDDIRLAAKANGKDPDTFIRQVEGANALPLATIPITLEMLLQTGELTSNRRELYEKGIRRLCRQAGERDVSEKRLSERVKAASSTAAVMLLSDRYRVDIESESIGGSVLSVRDLLRDSDLENEEKLARETLNTGLFEGAGQRSWSHHSFGEYLAAVYLSSPEITVKEIVKSTTNGKGVFVTKLYEVLRWLIEMRPDVLKEIVECQPSLLLTTDLSHLDKQDFRRVYKAMLSLDDPYIYSRKTWNLKKFRATHPIASQVLLPYLQDNEDNIYRRRFVLDLLECHVYPDMEDTLVDLVLNEYEDGVLRRLAARGVQKVGSIEAKLELKPYAFGKDDDPNDEIKGYALQALWPEYLTAEELFEALCPPKCENLFGSYRHFLIEDNIICELQADDLYAALNWVAAQPSRHEMPYSLQDLPGKIMRKTWDNIHMPGVLEAFAQTAMQMTLRFDGIFGGNSYDAQISDDFEQAFVQASDARRELVLMTLPHLHAKNESGSRLTFCRPPLVVPEDLEWLLELLDSELDEARRSQLAELVARLARYGVEKVYEASERHHELKQLTKGFFVSVLDDPCVVSEREHFRKMKEIDEKIARQRSESRPLEVIASALDGLDKGELCQWHNVLHGLKLDPATLPSIQIDPDVTNWANWQLCDEETQRRIVCAARYYVLKQDEIQGNEGHWFDTTSYPWIEWNGYMALNLLLARDIDAILDLPTAKWERWSKVIARFPIVANLESHFELVRERQNALLRMLYQRAPHSYINDIRRLLVAEDRREESLYGTVEKINLLWDAKHEATLMELLRSERLSAKGQRSLLDVLAKHDSDCAVRFAEEMIRKGYSDEVEKERLVELCVGLVLSEREFDWKVVWNEMQNCENVGKAIVEKVAEDDRSHSKFSDHLTVLQLADLFIWVETQYPSSEDPQFDGVHVVSTREQVGRWRNNIILALQKKDSQEALPAIRRILDRFPQLEWIQFVRVDIEEASEVLDWKPTLPKDVLDLTVVEETRPQIWKRKFANFLKQHWPWLAGFAAKYLPKAFGLG